MKTGKSRIYARNYNQKLTAILINFPRKIYDLPPDENPFQIQDLLSMAICLTPEEALTHVRKIDPPFLIFSRRDPP